MEGQERMSRHTRTARDRAISFLRGLRRNERGSAAVAMAIASPVLIGAMGLGAETGYWYLTQRKLQHAADIAAHAAGVRKRVGDTKAGLQTAALRTATGSGFTASKDGTKIVNMTVNNPPLSGGMVGEDQAVEIILYEFRQRLLSSIFTDEPIRIPARAVAKILGGAPACVLALSGTAPRAVNVTGSTTVTLTDCSVASNSIQPDAYSMPNSAAFLTADCIYTVGGSTISQPSPGFLELEACEAVQQQAPVTPDPYADLPPPNYALTPCSNGNHVEGTVDPGSSRIKRFCGGLSLKGDVHFKPGIYVIDGGDFRLNGGNISGTDVMFYFANDATLDMTGNPTVSLKAPTPKTTYPELKPYVGVLFFGSRCNQSVPSTCSEVHQITGTSVSAMQGAIYMPGSQVEFIGNSTYKSSCLEVIADTVTFTGNSTISMGAACDEAGTKVPLANRAVKVVE